MHTNRKMQYFDILSPGVTLKIEPRLPKVDTSKTVSRSPYMQIYIHDKTLEIVWTQGVNAFISHAKSCCNLEN